MKILVAGSRNLGINEYRWTIGDMLLGLIHFDQGEDIGDYEWVTGNCASGPDQYPYILRDSGYPDLHITAFPADWDAYGKAAGPIRNQHMVDYCDMAIILWDGKSKGTKDCIDRMIESGKPFIFRRI